MLLKHTILFIAIIQLKLPYSFCQDNWKNCVACSIASMEELLQVERKAVQSLKNYIKNLEDKIDIIGGGLKMLFEENQKTENGEKAFELSPFDIFSLIHRLQFDAHDWELYLEQPVGTVEVENLKLYLSDMPTYLDVVEAVDGLNRLQKFHNITANNMTKGILRGRQYDAKLSALDAFAIAQNMFNRSKFHEANEWAEEALRLYEENILNDIFESTVEDFYAFYAETLLELGNSTKALIALKKANTKSNRRHHEMEFIHYTDIKIIKNSSEEYQNSKEESLTKLSMDSCRNGFAPNISKLHCRLFDKTNAFLKLAPFKMEEISFDPYVVKFYDMISDKEIDHIKQNSLKNLKRSKIIGGQTTHLRTPKNAWFQDNATKIISNLNKRLSDMTGFNLSKSEPLQVMNYGLAGYYICHSDFINYTNFKDANKTETEKIYGDRIATALIYMNDVIDGGETIFPKINLAVKPEKGTTLLWYNLNDRGDCDPNVMHIACPVIVGSKWGITKWIREREQYRARPCMAIANNNFNLTSSKIVK